MSLNSELLMNITVEIKVELGSKKMKIQDVMNTSHGTVIELNKNVGDPFIFYVNDLPFGTCEIIQFQNGKCGMRILEIFSQSGIQGGFLGKEE